MPAERIMIKRKHAGSAQLVFELPPLRIHFLMMQAVVSRDWLQEEILQHILIPATRRR